MSILTKHEALAQCWADAGPASKTLGQRQPNIRPTPRVLWVYVYVTLCHTALVFQPYAGPLCSCSVEENAHFRHNPCTASPGHIPLVTLLIHLEETDMPWQPKQITFYLFPLQFFNLQWILFRWHFCSYTFFVFFDRWSQITILLYIYDYLFLLT